MKLVPRVTFSVVFGLRMRAFRLLVLLVSFIFTGQADGQEPALLTPAQQPLWALEEAAFQHAAQRVSHNIVKLELIGGKAKVGNVLLGDLSATGLVITPDGYLITSDFALSSQPAGIVAVTGTGERLVAELVAKDLVHHLALLKLKDTRSWPAVEFAEPGQVRVGQWTVAVGRTYQAEEINLSVGILSAVNRVWGRAIQTDAKISPQNYGGPLVDIQGRVLGVLTVFDQGFMSGYDFYDSGIGFAVPLTQVLPQLERWKQGDLKPGLLGVKLKYAELYEPCVVSSAQAEGPAKKAGIKAGDQIVTADGKPIRTTADFKFVVSKLYAGDRLQLEVKGTADSTPRPLELELIDKLPAFRWPFLGLELRASRGLLGTKLEVAKVLAHSPAATAGVQPGDVVTALQGQPIKGLAAVDALLAELQPDSPVRADITRGNEQLQLSWNATEVVESWENVPPAVPADRVDLSESTEVKLPQHGNTGILFAPKPTAGLINLGVRPGMLVWFQAPDMKAEHEHMQALKQVCAATGMTLFVPGAKDPIRWQDDDLEYVQDALVAMQAARRFQPERLVLAGDHAGVSAAVRLATARWPKLRGVIALDGTLPGDLALPNAEFGQRHSWLIGWGGESQLKPGHELDIKACRAAGYPTTRLEAKESWSPEQMEALRQWLGGLAYR